MKCNFAGPYIEGKECGKMCRYYWTCTRALSQKWQDYNKGVMAGTVKPKGNYGEIKRQAIGN